MLDEIHVKRQIEYSALQGQLLRLSKTEEVTSTVLAFMVTSLRSKYWDIVALYPVSGLTADKLNGAFLEVITRLDKLGLNVLTVITDLATNQRFFQRFSVEES